MRNNTIFKTLLVFAFILTACTVHAQITPWQMVHKMGRGINIGNTMDAPDEGRWADPIQEYFFDDYVDAGFTCVRIPVRWENHIADSAPYSIDSAWLDRVEQVIDWSLQRGLVTIINAHHDDWLYVNFADSLIKFESLWRQIAVRFRDKPENLLFEIINEPYFDLTRAQIDTMNQTILPIIRQTNPTRIVLITGGGNDTQPRLTNYLVVQHLIIPDDHFVMAYFHYYKPGGFTRGDVETWGTEAEKQEIADNFDVVKNFSDEHNIPFLLGEFAVDNDQPRTPRLAWLQCVVDNAVQRGFATTVWCTGIGNKFTYLRRPGAWVEEQLNILTGQSPFGGQPWPAPGVIEAEDFDLGGPRVAYISNDTLNVPGYYRPDNGVDIDSIAAQNYAVRFNSAGEWLEYTFKTDTTGIYYISVHCAAEQENRNFYLRFNGKRDMGPNTVPVNGAKQFTVVRDSFYIESGVHVMRLATGTGGIWVDKIDISKATAGTDGNLLLNPGFEQGTLNWTPKQCTMGGVDSPVHSGGSALKISDRQKVWAGAWQDVTEKLLKKGPGYYTASGFFRTVVDSGVATKVKVRLTYGGKQHHIGALGKMNSSRWALASDTLALTWDGELQEALFFIQTDSGFTGDFYVDDVSLVFDSTMTSIDSADRNVYSPQQMNLTNFPNPFNSSTIIAFHLPKSARANVVIYDLVGRRVKVLSDEFMPQGRHKLQWDGTDRRETPLPSGVYFAVLTAGKTVRSKKLIFLR